MPARIAGRVIIRKVCQAEEPRVLAACSCSVPISRSTGMTSRATKGMQTNIVARTIPGRAIDDPEAVLGQPRPEPAVAPVVDDQQGEPDDDRRDAERQIEQRPEQPLAAKVLADHRQREEDAEDRVDGDDDQGDQQRQPEGVDEGRSA